ncbi:MAG: hypothetical protein EXS14_02530 [Planctomycetes bacterium]|nr:hypothetical protein [Planctomycetota bacterium]
MKLRKGVCFLVIVSLFVACAAVDITKTHKGSFDPTNANDVEILKTRPEKSYEELGTATVSGFDVADVAKMHNALRTKAAELGAHAVLITDEGVVPGGFGAYTRWAMGVAIRYKK